MKIYFDDLDNLVRSISNRRCYIHYFVGLLVVLCET
jgi:hypothetical protein